MYFILFYFVLFVFIKEKYKWNTNENMGGSWSFMAYLSNEK